MPFLAPCYTWSSKYKKKTLQSSKVLLWTIWDFSPPNAHIFKKQVILNRKVLKMQLYSSVTLHVSPKNPISAEKWKINFSKIRILPQKFFLIGLVLSKLKLYIFEMDFITIQLKLTVPNKCGFRSWKGSNIWTMFYGLSNADFAPQNHGNIVSGTNKYS